MCFCVCVVFFSSKDKKSGELIRWLLLCCDLSSTECRVWKKYRNEGGKKAQDSNYRECSQSWNSQRWTKRHYHRVKYWFSWIFPPPFFWDKSLSHPEECASVRRESTGFNGNISISMARTHKRILNIGCRITSRFHNQSRDDTEDTATSPSLHASTWSDIWRGGGQPFSKLFTCANCKFIHERYFKNITVSISHQELLTSTPARQLDR